jgi:hypothetical protein
LFYFFNCESNVSFPISGLLAIHISPVPLRIFLFVGSLLREQKANPANDRLDSCSLSLAMGDQLLDNMSFRCDWIDVRHELASLRHPGQHPRVVATVSDRRLLVPGDASDRMGIWPKQISSDQGINPNEK